MHIKLRQHQSWFQTIRKLPKNQIKNKPFIIAVIREASKELAGPVSVSLCQGNTAPFEKMSQLWLAVGNTVSDLTGLRLESQTFSSRDERVTALPTGWFPENPIL